MKKDKINQKFQLRMTRRQVLKAGVIGGVGLMLPWRFNLQKAFAEYVGNNTLDPSSITKFASPLVIPPAMPTTKGTNKNKDMYKIAVRQLEQQILPSSQFGTTTVWSYGSIDHPNTFNYPAFTIEATANKDTQVQWRNELVDAMKNPLPHLLPVDPTLHWANPIGQRDTRPNPADAAYWTNPYLDGVNGSYTGPVPMVVHVHGAHTTEDSDGYPEAWYLPATATGVNWLTGTFFDIYNARYGQGWTPGTATFKYPNTQRATSLWYHDHTLGMTRLNVYAGPAGFYLIRGGPDDVVIDSSTGGTADLPGPAPGTNQNPVDPTGIYEIPIVFQDRSFADPEFTTSGKPDLWYPNYRAFFEGLGDLPEPLQIPFTPNQAINGMYSDVAPIWQPEFFGNVMVVNGVSWPHLDVKREQYRFRLLNGCNSRFLILDFSSIPNVQVWQIGAEGGFLRNPVNITADRGNKILMGLAERADVIVDFRSVTPGTHVLRNVGPDEPFGGDPVEGSGEMPQMREVMQFRVSSDSPTNMFTEVTDYVLPAIADLTPTITRDVSLNEEMSHAVFVPFDVTEDEFVLATDGNLYEVAEGDTPTEDSPGVWILASLPGVIWNQDWSAEPFGPTAALLGNQANGNPLLWMDPVTENPAAGTTETWNIYNLTVDAHPIHIHLVQFQVVGRAVIGEPSETSVAGSNSPLPTEDGFKDTVIAYPNEITTVKAKFDIPGRFVWHCHIVEHEDNEMMRPYDVV